MRRIPASIKDHISNAHYYREASDKLSLPIHNAARILLLLTAYENIQIAKGELSAWAQNTPPPKELYKSHDYKFRKVSPITYIDPHTSVETKYSSGADFKKLLSLCRYGHKTGLKQLALIFARGWQLSYFRNSLIDKMEWAEMMVEIYEGKKKNQK